MLKEQYKQKILPIKSELEGITQKNYSKQKEQKRKKFFKNRWNIIKNPIRSWSDQSESLSDFWRKLLSNKDLDIRLPETPLLNRRLLENLAKLETLVIYCCPAFGLIRLSANISDKYTKSASKILSKKDLKFESFS